MTLWPHFRPKIDFLSAVDREEPALQLLINKNIAKSRSFSRHTRFSQEILLKIAFFADEKI